MFLNRQAHLLPVMWKRIGISGCKNLISTWWRQVAMQNLM
jgi:hypothetical protein